MAYVSKILGKSNPAATTNTVLYTAPNTATGAAVVSTLTICNQAASATTFRVALCNTAITTPAAADYVYYDVSIPANQTFAATLGWTLGQDQRIVIYAGSTNLSFVATGQEQA